MRDSRETIVEACRGQSIAVGVDPGRKTGFAVWNRGVRRWSGLYTLDFWEAFWTAAEIYREAVRLVVVIEDSMQNKFVYGRHMEVLAKNASRKNIETALAQTAITGMKIGRNHAEGDLLATGLARWGCEVHRQKPMRDTWDHKTFCRYTKYPKKTNEHTRVAGRLVYDY